MIKEKSSFEYITTSVYKGVGNLPHTIFYKTTKKDTIYYEEINNYINVNIFCMY